jgi:pSer/pThr/pTyr-binding forkhead associated (FHA) protein
VAYLTQYSNSVPVIKFPIDQILMTIGQHIDMDICIPEDGIADKHAELEAVHHSETYRFIIKSVEEQQTIQLNGERVSHAELQDGDWLLIGDIEFKFTNDGINEIEDVIVPIATESPKPVELNLAKDLKDDAPVIKTAQMLRDNRFSRRLNRF